MGTGIVSIGLYLEGRALLSQVLFGIDVALWAGMFIVFARRALWQRARWIEETRSPAGLTAVAGTGVLGARVAFAGIEWAAFLLLAGALCLWAGLLVPVLRHWRTPTVGVSFVLTVATESLAVLAALLALMLDDAWLEIVALFLLALGLAAYGFVLARFDLHELFVGRGDQWVSGGALAIAALACARVAAAASAGHLGPARGFLDDASFALWVAAVAWLPVLLAAELVSHRFAYDTRRWATVFPFGMYAVCSFAVGDVVGIRGLVDFGRIWIWVAFALWATVCAAMVGRGLEIARTGRASAVGL
jgi:hypothetical protein